MAFNFDEETLESMSREELLALIQELRAKLENYEQDVEHVLEDRMRIEIAVGAVNMAWWGLDVVTGAVEFHKKKAEMLDFPPEKFKHYQDFTDLLHPDDYELAMESMRMNFRGESKTYEVAYRIKKANGEYTWFWDIGAVIKRDPGGKPLKAVGFVLDISKQKEDELKLKQTIDELARVNAEKDKFFSIIAHDLRGPISALMQMSGILKEYLEELSDHEKREFVASLEGASKNVYSLLENLLQWSRIKRGHVDFSREKMDLATFINDAIKVFHEQINFKEITFKVEIPQGKVLYADRHMMSVVVRNLVSNAIKFTPRNGNITVSGRELDDGSIVICVKDTGIGIPGSMLDHLFRIDAKTKRPGTEGEPSSGLGLLLIKEYVDIHGGEIEVESVDGSGTTFTVRLP